MTGSQLPLGTAIQLSVIPQFGPATVVTTTPLTGAVDNSSATANVTMPIGTGAALVLMAQVTINLQSAALVLPAINGERVEAIRLNAQLAGASSFMLVTESGRQIPVDNLGPLLQRRLEASGVK